MTFASSALDEHDTQPLLRSFSHYADDPEPLSRSPSSSFSLSEYKAISTKHRDHSSSFSSSSYESPSDISSASQSDDLVEPDEEGSKFSALFLGLLWGGRGKAKMTEPDLDTCATKRSVFDDSVLARHYWPKDGYEGSAKFDVNARWSLREEKALVRKIDWHVMLWAVIMFASLNMDRSNLVQANTDNFLDDLGLTTDDYNMANSLFRIAFLISELPSQMVAKHLGADRYIPIQICLWSLATCWQFFLSGRKSFLWCRILIGFIQGGFVPEMVVYLSYWYTKTELPIRLAFFWMSSNVATIFTSLLAFAVLNMRGFMGQAGWRWLFLVEGVLTLSVGVATFFKMPPSPVQTKTWFRPEGWFTSREETICVTRILRDDPTKGDMHNREGLSFKRLWTACLDYDLWPLFILGFTFGIPPGPPTTYLTLSLRNLGFDAFTSNLLTIPSVTIALITALTIVVISEQVNDRAIVAMTENIWILPFLLMLYWLPVDTNPWFTYAITIGLLSYPHVHPIQVAWCSRNSGAVASRTVNASLYNMMVQLGGVASAQIYRADDAPQYQRGNRTLILISCLNIFVLYPGTKLYYIWRNRQKSKAWDRMTTEERSAYLQTTTDVGNRRLDFRFAH